MTSTPSYIVHHVDEEEVTVDWFFGKGHAGTKLSQLILVLLGWFFAVLPIVITTSAILNRHNDDAGWWGYHEGFVIWEMTVAFLGILVVFFIVGFLVLHFIGRVSARRREQQNTYDEKRLEQRLEIADNWYAHKFGSETLRLQQTRIRIKPYGDVETYELRGLYREHGVD